MTKTGKYGGLDRWFAEKWVDVKSGKPCGRTSGEKRAYPACRPSKRVNKDTPKTSKEMSSAEKKKFKTAKTSSTRIPYIHKQATGGILLYKSGGNLPTNPGLWKRSLAAARSKYAVDNSAYANGYAAKLYKSKGGTWKKSK